MKKSKAKDMKMSSKKAAMSPQDKFKAMLEAKKKSKGQKMSNTKKGKSAYKK